MLFASDAIDVMIDTAVMTAARPQWQKVAMLAAVVMLDSPVRDVEHEDIETRIADRVMHLIDSGMLESRGDVTRWRHSEVRLADKASTADGS